MRIFPVKTKGQLEDALAVRYEVFVTEQGVAEDAERDHLDDDPRTLHCLVVADEREAFESGVMPGVIPGFSTGILPGMPMATGRLLAPNTDSAHGEGTGYGLMDASVPHIGRVAVLAGARGSGAGRAVMRFLEEAALERHGANGEVRVELSAQDQAMPFYERLGYIAYGDAYLDEGISHHDAFKIVTARDS